ncbi:MAG: branched-chain amino acid ABC transporter permease [Burkholderiaceae bacterium]|nr:branched-chain amino acid ABC transporter permease [Burkholderiaceae bacterium]
MGSSMFISRNRKSSYVAWSILLLCMGLLPLMIEKVYYLHLMTIMLIWIILTQGLNVIQGYAGYVSICQATFFGIGAYASALVTVNLGWPVGAGFVASLLAGLVAGLFIGWPSLKMKGHYFAIATMAFAVLVGSVMHNWKSVTGGDAGLHDIPRPEFSFAGFELGSPQGYYYLVLIAAAASVAFVGRLVRSRVGRSIVAVRENEAVAAAIGIDTTRSKRLAFLISAVLGSISGAFYVHYINFLNPTPFHLDASLNAILAVIIGGAGTVWGPVIGSALVVFLPEYLRVATEYRMVIYGALIILVVIFMPRGVMGIWERFRPEGGPLIDGPDGSGASR